jgi:flagellar biosynthesis component FlhA
VRKLAVPLIFFLALAVLVSLVSAEPAQRRDPQMAPQRNEDPKELEREREMERRRNEDRHKALRQDTEKLLELATELKKAVDDSSENKLSLEVIRKAEEVERLAKQVRNKMRGL